MIGAMVAHRLSAYNETRLIDGAGWTDIVLTS